MSEHSIKQQTNLSEQLKSAMRYTCNMVYVVSTGCEVIHRNAITITSFTVASLAPASVIFCVNKISRFSESITKENNFCINIMPTHLENIAAICSETDIKRKFESNEWVYSNGLPYLASANANIFCVKNKIIESGTHFIIMGTVTKILSLGKAPPLLYHDRQYKTLFSKQIFK